MTLWNLVNQIFEFYFMGVKTTRHEGIFIKQNVLYKLSVNLCLQTQQKKGMSFHFQLFFHQIS